MIKLLRGSGLIVWLGFGLMVSSIMNLFGLWTRERELTLMRIFEKGSKTIFPYMFDDHLLGNKEDGSQ